VRLVGAKYLVYVAVVDTFYTRRLDKGLPLKSLEYSDVF
jgi:hypothetical protein